MTELQETRKTGVRELSGIVLLTFSLLMVLALVSYQWKDIPVLKVPTNNPVANFIGPAGAWFSFVALMVFGVGAIFIPVVTSLIGIILLFSPKEKLLPRVIWGTIAIITVSCLIKLHPAGLAPLCHKFNIIGISGGVLGWLVADRWLDTLFGTAGATILITGILIGSLFMFIGKQAVYAFLQKIYHFFLFLKNQTEIILEARHGKLDRIAREERAITRQQAIIEKAVGKKKRRVLMTQTGAVAADNVMPKSPLEKIGAQEQTEQSPFHGKEPESHLFTQPTEKNQPEEGKARAKKSELATAESSAKQRLAYQLPPISLLKPVPLNQDRKIKSDFQITSRIVKETLAEFGIESEITNIEQGPVITRYELLPAPGVRVEKIGQLSNNLALTLKATSVRVQAPIPGKGVVGIEIPNSIANCVYLREVLEGEEWKSSKAAIPIILGKDVAGKDLVADLAVMPHLLIAGSTGSGKTVCINSILAGLLMSRTPDQLRLLLVDPKIVEFAVYNRIPHLVIPVITNPKKVTLGLRWAINEMEKRYKLFARAGVRTIQSYNNKEKDKHSAFVGVAYNEEEIMPDRIPYIVIVIDELADLMSVAQADIENSIARLAQLSRAVGIHMILATQRPSVNVITGTIKANFPARVSFQVAQKVDSRTILDTSGADKLLGRGDMLILPPGTSKLVRAQGAMTTDEDVNAIVNFIRKQAQPNYEIDIKESIEKAGTSTALNGEEDDDLIEQAIEIIRQAQRASVSLLQRRMKIGYNRAGRLMDVLEDRGVVGPAHGSDPREILIDLDVEIPANNPADDKEES